MNLISLAPDEQVAAPIRLVLSDVDGVLTNGRIIYDHNDIETKCFHVRDGLGIKLWQKAGFHFGILTARNSQVVQRRADELGIKIVHQGVAEKWPAATEILDQLGISPEETCYIGDDLPDLAVLKRVGLPVTVADACDDVRRTAYWTTRLGGGEGAVRELIERLLRAKKLWKNILLEASA